MRAGKYQMKMLLSVVVLVVKKPAYDGYGPTFVTAATALRWQNEHDKYTVARNTPCVLWVIQKGCKVHWCIDIFPRCNIHVILGSQRVEQAATKTNVFQ